MKKIFALILALILSCSVAFAAVPDISGCTDEELRQLIDLARNRLYVNALKVEKDAVLVDQDGILLYMTGEYIFDYMGPDFCLLRINGVLVNNNSFKAGVYFENCSANGWEIHGPGVVSAQPGKKTKCELTFDFSEAELYQLEGLEDLTFTMHISNSENYKTIFTLESVTFTAASFGK